MLSSSSLSSQRQTTNDKFLKASYNSSDAVAFLAEVPATLPAWLHVSGTLKESTGNGHDDDADDDDTWFGDEENHSFLCFCCSTPAGCHGRKKQSKVVPLRHMFVGLSVGWLVDARPR